VQSLNPPTLEAIRRRGNWDSAKKNILELMSEDNLHLHLDLIAGLPEETMATFEAALDELHSMAPHYLQLGFLKILPGSFMAEEVSARNLCADPYPPYRVRQTTSMSAEELLDLAQIEAALDAFYNSGLFRQSLHLAASLWPGGAAALYRCIAKARKERGRGSLTSAKKAELLYEVYGESESKDLLRDVLRFDWFLYGPDAVLPPLLSQGEKSHHILRMNYLPVYEKGGIYSFSSGKPKEYILSFKLNSKNYCLAKNSLCAGRLFEIDDHSSCNPLE